MMQVNHSDTEYDKNRGEIVKATIFRNMERGCYKNSLQMNLFLCCLTVLRDDKKA